MHVNKEADYRGFVRASEATRRHDEFKGKMKKVFFSLLLFVVSFLFPILLFTTIAEDLDIF